MTSPQPFTNVGAVVIGRNEGERLRRCLESMLSGPGRVTHLVYVDSGSTDDSVEIARGLGAQVHDLDTSVKFTAARARNAGAEQLLATAPQTAFIQFVDGDCELDPAWIATALDAIRKDPRRAVVCGRRGSGTPSVRSTTGCATSSGTRRSALRTPAGVMR